MKRRLLYIVVVLVVLVPATMRLGFTAWPFLNEDEKPTLAPLLEEAMPAVVNVSVIGNVPQQQNPLLNDPFFERFFDVPQMPRRRGVGSGVIVDAEQGLVISNHHVIENAAEIVVVLSDRRQFDAELVGTDPGTDIAVLRIEAEGLTEIPLADSDNLRVGDYVVAIGNPFGLGQTATTGIVSALGRTGINLEGYEDFIQTDASINPGNSGGALIDLDGAIVGINTAIVSPGGGNVGIGFAVPSNMARQVMEQVLEYGEVRRGQLGVTIQDLTPALAEALQLDIQEGAIVTDVQAGSAAEQAGLLAGDVVTAVNGKRIVNSSSLRNEIGFKRPGESVELAIVRNGEARSVRAQVGETQAAPQARTGAGADSLAGAEIVDLPPTDPRRSEIQGGVLVARVEPGSNAAANGLREQDIILAVNRTPVGSVIELNSALAQAPGAVALTVQRGGQRLFLVLQ